MTLTAKEYCKGVLIDACAAVYSREHYDDIIPKILKYCKEYGIGKGDYSAFWELIYEEFSRNPTVLDGIKRTVYDGKEDYPIYEMLKLLEEEGYVDADTPLVKYGNPNTLWDFLADALYVMVINDDNYDDMLAESLWFEVDHFNLLE